jgi:RecA/RadA recombinase
MPRQPKEVSILVAAGANAPGVEIAVIDQALQAVNAQFRRPPNGGRKAGKAGNLSTPRTVLRRGSQVSRLEGMDVGQPWLKRLLASIGGLPRGRVVNIFGPPDAGKSTTALIALAEVIAAGGIGVLCDAEGKFDPDYGRRLGLDLSRLIVLEPVPEMFEILRELARQLEELKLTIDLIVIDSATATPSSAASGAAPRFLNAQLPPTLKMIKKHKACLLIISQERAIPMGESDAKIVGTGGFGLLHDSTVIIEFVVLQSFARLEGGISVPYGMLIEAFLRKLHAGGTLGSVRFTLPKEGASGDELTALGKVAELMSPSLARPRKRLRVPSTAGANGASASSAQASLVGASTSK